MRKQILVACSLVVLSGCTSTVNDSVFFSESVNLSADNNLDSFFDTSTTSPSYSFNYSFASHNLLPPPSLLMNGKEGYAICNQSQDDNGDSILQGSYIDENGVLIGYIVHLLPTYPNGVDFVWDDLYVEEIENTFNIEVTFSNSNFSLTLYYNVFDELPVFNAPYNPIEYYRLDKVATIQNSAFTIPDLVVHHTIVNIRFDSDYFGIADFLFLI